MANSPLDATKHNLRECHLAKSEGIAEPDVDTEDDDVLGCAHKMFDGIVELSA